MFLKIDGTFAVQIINFAIFFVLLNAIFLRPVGRAVRARRAYIDALLDERERFQTEAASLRAQAENIRAAARREAEHALARARAEISNQTAESAARYAREVAEIVAAAHRTVDGELKVARVRELQTVRELAGLMVARAISEGRR